MMKTASGRANTNNRYDRAPASMPPPISESCSIVSRVASSVAERPRARSIPAFSACACSIHDAKRPSSV
jgi:hypothetical protein